jgi:hypothetical protein
MEISNVGESDFYGDFILKRVKRSDADLSVKAMKIPAHTSVVFADAGVEHFLDTAYIVNANAALEFSDTKAIDVELVYEDETLDTFTVGAISLKNKQTSLEKVFVDDEWMVAPTVEAHSFNVSSGVFANP